MQTYMITNPEATVYGAPVGLVTDALTGATTACYQGGHRVALGVPLCGGCDRQLPHEDAHCESCEA